jgi:alcohol dehydrogenase (cytochrome c)
VYSAFMRLFAAFVASSVVLLAQPPAPQSLEVRLTDGHTLEGQVLGRGLDDLQLRTSDGKMHLLRAVGAQFREVTSQVDWPQYNGDVAGNRFTSMAQITPQNIGKLAPKWTYTIQGAARLQVTPVVVEGVMFVTAQNEVIALDAGTGREVWHYRRPRTAMFANNATGGAQRGVAVAGDRVFMLTDHAHIIALDRHNGTLLWDTEMADFHESYFSSSAPLVAGNTVVGGVGGGEHGARGFLAGFDIATGKELWRFWTVPKPGDTAYATWTGGGAEHGGAPTWFTGSYDRDTDTVYWQVGNPSAEYNGDNRMGDNLYSDCVLALDAKTGALKWYFQFTPHDLWDWDATETVMLVDANWQGRPRKLLLQANRNGFFYVLDRVTGEFLSGKPFVRNLTWASGIDPKGRPIYLPNQNPSEAGTLVCPSQDGASNWFSPSYNAALGMVFFQTFEKCSVYNKRDVGEWKAGEQYLGGTQRGAAGQGPPMRVLKALNLATGEIAWELPQPGTANSWGGTLATSTGLVIFGAEGGALAAADARTGTLLWSFPTNQLWKASPMTYMFDNKQYVGVASNTTIYAFGLME